MKWIRFTIDTCVDAVDILSYELDEIGVEGIEIEDHLPLSEEDKQKMFVDILPDPVEVDDKAKVSFYMDSETCDPERVLLQVQQILAEVGSYSEIGEGTVSISETEDKDWINNWKQYFKPFRASDRIAICPTWMEPDTSPEILTPTETGEDPMVLRIDPGIAFGTGSHETTKLCIQALDRLLKPGDRILDVGCGSGILSITALLLGASHVTAIDIDELAVNAARENFDANAVDSTKYNLFQGNLLSDNKVVEQLSELPYDIVAANILPDVLVPLTPLVPRLLRAGGVYITSGILAERAEEVRDALVAAGFSEIVLTPMGEWVAFSCSLR